MFHFNYDDLYVLDSFPPRYGLEIAYELTPFRDPTNPFLGQHVSLCEHHIIGVPRGPSMLEEKLACPMEDAAHERQFQTAQQGSSASTFLDQHVAIIARTIAMMTENVFLDSGMMSHEKSSSLPGDPVEIAACAERQTRLLCVGDHFDGVDNPAPDRIRDSDVPDLGQWDSIDVISSEKESMLRQARGQRIRLYRQGPAHLRVVYKPIFSPAALRLRTKSHPSVRDLPKSSTGL
jgi:hypothetical protein